MEAEKVSGWMGVLVIAVVLSAVTPPATGQFYGWAVGDHGTVLHTSNGGDTWISQPAGTVLQRPGVCFVNASNGWAVGKAGAIQHTSNGGSTWSSENSGTTADLFGVSFVDGHNGWAVGSGGAILHTSNGGSTWSSQSSGTMADLFAVSFVDANNGWTVGSGGTILYTNNGGSAWSSQSGGTMADLFGVSFVDTNNGWVVGSSGAILHTSNGGSTWSPQGSGTANGLFDVSFVAAPSSRSVAVYGLQPSSGPAGTIVKISGNGFTPTGGWMGTPGGGGDYGGNTVRLGPDIVLKNLNSTDGVTLQFGVPQQVAAGTYRIIVANANGVSNAIYFTVTQN